MEEVDFKELKKELIKMGKKRREEEFKVKQHPTATEAMASFERAARNAETYRNRKIGTILKLQQFFPERAIRILSKEILEGLEIQDIELIISEYGVTEEELAEVLISKYAVNV